MSSGGAYHNTCPYHTSIVDSRGVASFAWTQYFNRIDSTLEALLGIVESLPLSQKNIQNLYTNMPSFDEQENSEIETHNLVIPGPQGVPGAPGAQGVLFGFDGADGDDATATQPPGTAGNGTSMSTGFVSTYMDFAAQAANPPAPITGVARFHALTTQGFTRFEQDNEAATNVTIGRDSVFIVKNTSGSSIGHGSPIYVTGATGNVPNISLARADSLSTLPAVGIALDTIADNAFGQCMLVGIHQPHDTSAFVAGDQLWVSSTVAGGFVNVRPVSPAFAQRMGSVLVSGVGNGALLIDTAPFIGGVESGTSLTVWRITGDVEVLDSTKGLILKDAAVTPHYWRVGISTLGAIVTTDLGTSPV